jgi:DNA-binding Lrp family transcriptional regulator
VMPYSRVAKQLRLSPSDLKKRVLPVALRDI